MELPSDSRRFWQRTREVLLRSRQARSDSETHRGRLPRPGDLFLFEEGAELGVFWALIDVEPENERCLLVVADGNAALGSRDVGVPADSACGALSLRCGIEVRLDDRTLSGGRCVGALEPGIVDRAREKRVDLEAGRNKGTLTEHRTDLDLEYRDWLEELYLSREALLR